MTDNDSKRRICTEGQVKQMEYEWIRSARKTMSLEVKQDGKVIVRTPMRCGRARVERFVREKQDWIIRVQQEMEQKVKEREERKENLPQWTREDYEHHQRLAGEVLQQRAAYFAQRMGVDYGRISVRDQKTRWGSCSAKGNLNFNWRLILAPEQVLDYVVVHELAHRREMNHSKRFWALVEAVLPDYQSRRRWLKENGDLLMSR